MATADESVATSTSATTPTTTTSATTTTESTTTASSSSSTTTAPEKPRVKYEWHEVTQHFLDDARELSLGELLHDDMFGLMEAMSAIEMMDPKMDAGMRRDEGKGPNGQPLTFESATKSGLMKLVDISPLDRLQITTASLQCLTTWLEGHSLAQTVFTNLYLHKLDEVQDQVVKPVGTAVLKLVDLIRDTVQRAGVFEEEDFQHLTFNFDLASSTNDSKAMSMLRGLEEEQQRALRRMRSSHNEESFSQQKVSLESCLLQRLILLRHLYQSLHFISKRELSEARRCLNKCSDALAADFDLDDEDLLKPHSINNVMGFEKLANQRLLPPTFPRYTELHSWATSRSYIGSLVQRLLLVVTFEPSSSFQWAQDCFVLFSTRPSCMLSRSCLQLVYSPIVAFTKTTSLMSNLSSESLLRESSLWVDTLKDACRAFIAPPILSRSGNNSKQIRERVDAFFMHCSRTLGFMVQTFGHNSARQREKIVMLLEEIVSAQEEADKLDSLLHNAQSSEISASSDQLLYFSTWLLYSILKVMVRYVLSGFELELYSHHEYCYLYWYLYEMLYPWIISCLHRADTHLAEADQKSINGKGKKKSREGRKKKTRPHGREIALYQGLSALCAGYFKLMVGLKREQKILLPQSLFDNEALRYERRFEPFATLLTPPLMHYGKYLEVYTSNQNLGASLLFTTAGHEFERSRHIFKSIMSQHPLATATRPQLTFAALFDDDINTLIAVGHNNHIVANVLARDCSRNVNFEFNTHQSFPTVKITH